MEKDMDNESLGGVHGDSSYLWGSATQGSSGPTTLMHVGISQNEAKAGLRAKFSGLGFWVGGT